MRNATLWRALLGVERTVIESIEYDEDAGEVAACVRPHDLAEAGAGSVVFGRCGTTAARDGGGGEPWTSGLSRCGWRPTRRG